MEDLILKPALDDTEPPVLVVQEVQPAASEEVVNVANAIQDLEQLGDFQDIPEREPEPEPEPELPTVTEVPTNRDPPADVCISCMHPLRVSPSRPPTSCMCGILQKIKGGKLVQLLFSVKNVAFGFAVPTCLAATVFLVFKWKFVCLCPLLIEKPLPH